MISRRESFKVFASGAAMGLTGAVIVSTTSCAPTEAPAAVHDPLLEALELYDAENLAVYAIKSDDECAAACEARIQPLLLRLRDKTPTATTAAGALAALRFVEYGMEIGETIADRAVLKAAMSYLEGRASA